MEKTKKSEGEAAPTLRFLTNFVFIAATISAIFGLLVLLTAFEDEPLLKQTDPLLGLSARLALLIVMLLCFGLSICLFVGHNFTYKGIALLWVGFIFTVYGLGMFWVQRRGPCPVVILTGWRLGIWPATLNLICQIVIGSLMGGGILILILQRRRQMR